MYIRPNDKDVLSLFGLIFPYLFLANIILCLLALRFKRITLLIAVIITIFSIPSFLGYIKVFGESQDPRKDLSVLTFNAMLGYRFADEKGKKSIDKLITEGGTPEVLCLQEVNDKVAEMIKGLGYYSYHYKAPDRAVSVHSKLPIINRGLIDFGQKINACIWIDVLTENMDTLRVYNVHFESNRLSRSSYSFLDKEDYEPTEAINGIQDLLVKYPRYAGVRARQAQTVKRHMNNSPHPTIIAGDFNDPPVSFTYRTIAEGMTDTFKERGRGLATTWTGPIPLLRIDYIFADDFFINTSVTTIKSDLSDHYPVKASFLLNKKETK